jgi:hypothetical protein
LERGAWLVTLKDGSGRQTVIPHSCPWPGGLPDALEAEADFFRRIHEPMAESMRAAEPAGPAASASSSASGTAAEEPTFATFFERHMARFDRLELMLDTAAEERRRLEERISSLEWAAKHTAKFK